MAQTADKLVLETIFEVDFAPNAYHYRPKKSALDAVRVVRAAIRHGGSQVVVDADLASYVDTIPHRPLLRSVARRISDERALRWPREIFKRLGLSLNVRKIRVCDARR